jgi:hypothetical protein
MNILIRIENREDIARVEELLSHLDLDIYFVSDDRRMLSILEQSSFDAVLLGFSTDRTTVNHSIWKLRDHKIGAAIPVMYCCENDGSFVPKSIEYEYTDVERLTSAIRCCYKVEILSQPRHQSRDAFSKLTC